MVPLASAGAIVIVSLAPCATLPVDESSPRTETVIGWSTRFAERPFQIVAGMVQVGDVVYTTRSLASLWA